MLPTIVMFIMAVILLMAMHILSDAAIDSDIRQQLKRSMYSNSHYVDIRGKDLEISEDFLYKDEYVHFLIIHRRKGILAGEYPYGIEEQMQDIRPRNNSVRSIYIDGEKYFFRDLRMGRRIFLRGIIKKSDADSVYRTIEWMAYMVIVGFVLLIFVSEFILTRRISRELKRLCSTAESIGNDMDISKRMEYEGRFKEISILAEANNRMLDRVEETFEMQEQFTSDVAHELRTPVAVMLAECQYAKERETRPEKFKESLDVVYRQSKKINRIITRLLEFSRLSQDRVEIGEEVIDLAAIAEVVCEDEQKKAGDAVSIEMDLQEVYTKGDINLISIVIQNLVSNAVKFSFAKGKIEVSTGETEKEVYVAVKDYGIGISKKDLSYIFRRFYKCDKARNAQGFGLGLDLSMKIVQKHGGTILVDSEEGKGSTFKVVLRKI